jgi:hypothetical protein
MSAEKKIASGAKSRVGKKRWTAPKLTYVNRLDTLVENGSKKVTVKQCDPGSSRGYKYSH